MNIDRQASPGSATTPLVTVIMCVYNAGEYLRPSLQSILAQTYQNLDVLMIDDGSTDGCFASVEDLLSDRRVRVYHQENATRPVALNRALDLVKGEFYAIQDGDDISHPARVATQVRALLSQPQLAAVFCGNELIINGKPMAPTLEAKDIAACKRDIEAFRMPAHDPTGMFRMSLVRDFRYQANLKYVEAVDYILRVGEQHPMMVLGECLYGYRILWDSVTRHDPSRRDRFVAEALRQACARRGVDYDQAFPQQRPKRSKNSVRDNNLAAHFIASVLDQRAIGEHWGALRTAWECARLHPLDTHYYKAMVYAVISEKVISFVRRQSAASRPRTRQAVAGF